MITNRDLYLKVSAVLDQHADGGLELADYLVALHGELAVRGSDDGIRVDDFVEALAAAFSSVPAGPEPDPEKRIVPVARVRRDDVEGLLGDLVADLRAMRENGALDSEFLYFGVDAPRGRRWYNFEPGGFVEAGIEGRFGGYQDGDPGRGLVSGPVAVLAEDGTVTSADPRDLVLEPVPVGDLTWEDVIEFLEMGHSYE